MRTICAGIQLTSCSASTPRTRPYQNRQSYPGTIDGPDRSAQYDPKACTGSDSITRWSETSKIRCCTPIIIETNDQTPSGPTIYHDDHRTYSFTYQRWKLPDTYSELRVTASRTHFRDRWWEGSLQRIDLHVQSSPTDESYTVRSRPFSCRPG